MINHEFERLLKDSFINNFEQCLSASADGRQWQIKSDYENQGQDCEEAVVLTVSSHLFRVVYFLYFNKSLACKNHIADALTLNLQSLSEVDLHDYLCEVGNSYFGGVKRDLGNAVLSLGMSTPNILNRSSFKYIDELAIISSGFATALLGDEALLYASYHLSAASELNFKVHQPAEPADAAADCGSLEFF